ncbi:hypothetical protein GDO86_002979 [Hymenochirus boettgeri]|uniref:Synaptotagmin-like protein 5 n=1 Tax=Hymenochirus boettgeri TaxID=247094 RepID=A0A8T2K416_9PIPI|nr:hypothetical protein GDO86_002979 [Hymenochirus boettgeri]
MSAKTEILNFSFLVDEEKQIILSVLERDDRLKKTEEKRVRKLKNELLEIRRKGGNRQRLRQQNSKVCVRCQKSLGLIFDRGDLCQVCQLRVCKACRVVDKNGKWKCTVCAKIVQLRITTGDWFFEERAKRFKNGTVLGSDIVRKSIMRKTPASMDVVEEIKGDVEKAQNGSVVENKTGKPGDTRNVRSDLDNQSLRSTRSMPHSERVSNLLDKMTGKKTRNGEDDTQSLKSTRSDRKPNIDVHTKAALSQQENADMISQSSFKVDTKRSSPVSVRGSVHSLDAAISAGKPKGRVPSIHSINQSDITAPLNQGSPTPSKRSVALDSKTPGIQNGITTSSSIPNDLAMKDQTDGSIHYISASRVTITSDHSISEMDISGHFTEANEETISIRSKSVPDLLNTHADDKMDEDFDAMMSSSNLSKSVRSLTSISLYSETGDYGNLKVQGEILLNINYSYKTGALNVLIKNCRNLAEADEKKNRTDPYVKAYLLPDKSRQSKRKTKIKTNTTNPDFNETLKYVISHTQLETRTLQLSVWHNDRFGRNSFLGEVNIPLDSWNFEKQDDTYFPLQSKVDLVSDVTLQYKGEITVALRYTPPEKNLSLPLEPITAEKKSFRKTKKSIKVPSGGLLDVLIKEAKNLSAMKSSSSSDTFVKGYLLPDDNKSTKHKTPIVRKSINPEWNHTFTFSGLQPSDLPNVCVELTVWGKESLTNNIFLGGVCLGCGSGESSGKEVDWMDSRGEEQFLWQKMMDNPESMVEATLFLRSSMARMKTAI